MQLFGESFIHHALVARYECGRRLATYLHQEIRLKEEYKKRNHIESFLPHIGIALQEILELSDDERGETQERLSNILHQNRKF